MKVDINIPDGKSGDWMVETFSVTKEDIGLFNIRSAFSLGNRRMEPGTYKRLTRNGAVIMSNTPAEISDHSYFVYQAEGDVLLNGLGLGVVLEMLLQKEDIESIAVIEQSEDVIRLVGTHYKTNPKVQIIHADALTWKPPKNIRYHSVWHDIWDNICADNLPTMHKLHRKYGKRSGWQGSWCRELCEM